jgi:hypothetical protein
MAQVNYPTIQLEINGVDFSESPPEYIQEYVLEDVMEGAFSVEFLLHDREYTRIEDAIFREPADREEGSIKVISSFGYMIDGELHSSNKLYTTIFYYLPSFGAGVDARIRSYALGVGGNLQASESLSFDSIPYHEVVQICAKKMLGETTDLSWIQETSEHQKFTGSTESFGTYMSFLKEKIEPYAVDQDLNSGFTLGFALHGDTVRFGTREFVAEKQLELKQEIPTFTWLAGQQDSDVIDFRPDFTATRLGGFAANGLKCVGWDAVQKRQVTIAVNPTSAALQKKTGKYLGKGAASVSLGKDATNQSVQGVGTQIREKIFGANSYEINQGTWLYDLLYGEARTNDVSGPESIPYAARLSLTENTIEQLEREAFSRWRTLFETVKTATLVLNGSERTTRMRAGDLVRVLVQIPKTNQVHWSSGVWWIDKVRHEMTSDYTVTCELKRNAYAKGVEQIPGGVTFFNTQGF